MELKPGYKRTEVGYIPADWDVVPLSQIASISAGGTPSRDRPEYWNGQIPWATTSEVDFCTIYATQQFISDEGLTSSAAKLLPPGTLLMALYGQGKTRGKVAVLGTKAATNQACAAISLHGNISRDYVFNFLTSRYDEIRKISNTGNQENLNSSIVRSILVALPSEAEQGSIARALTDADALLHGMNRLIAKKRDLKQAAMQHLLTGRSRLNGFVGAWTKQTLGGVIEYVAGGGTPSRSNTEYWGPDIPWATVKDFATFNPRGTQEAITRFGLLNSSSNLIPAGTLIVSTRMALGKAVCYEVDVAINQDLKAVFLKPGVDVRFMVSWFRCFETAIAEMGGGSTVKGISLNQLRRIGFDKPPLDEQLAIVAVLSDMDAEIAALEARRDKTRMLKQAMMQELLTGRTRLVEPPASTHAEPTGNGRPRAWMT